MVNTQARSDRGFLAVGVRGRTLKSSQPVGRLRAPSVCGARRRRGRSRAMPVGDALGAEGRKKKCPREAGSFGVGAYAQTCCASLQGGRQRSRICKCAIAKNGSEGILRSGAPAVLRISVTNRRRGRFFCQGVSAVASAGDCHRAWWCGSGRDGSPFADGAMRPPRQAFAFPKLFR